MIRHRDVAGTRRIARVLSRFAALAVCVLAAGCGGSSAPSQPVATAAASQTAASGSALAAVTRLTVKGRGPKTGYSREQFGDGWATVDGCDTRDRILSRDLRAKTFRAATNQCIVVSGRLADPYTSTTINYVRGSGAGVDIDHVVALSDAWQKGAQRWPARERVAFANDPLNLLAVDASANRQKGDGDTATWLPANKPFRCTYVARQVSVKLKYAVSVTGAEHDAMLRVLGTCPSKRVTVTGKVPVAAPTKPAASTGSPG
ncbi:MAG: HNH endonuclease family protein, partial [Solirubrobacteraceae bacterium]